MDALLGYRKEEEEEEEWLDVKAGIISMSRPMVKGLFPKRSDLWLAMPNDALLNEYSEDGEMMLSVPNIKLQVVQCPT